MFLTVIYGSESGNDGNLVDFYLFIYYFVDFFLLFKPDRAHPVKLKSYLNVLSIQICKVLYNVCAYRQYKSSVVVCLCSQTLFKAGEQKFGTDEQTFVTILGNRSAEHLRKGSSLKTSTTTWFLAKMSVFGPV